MKSKYLKADCAQCLVLVIETIKVNALDQRLGDSIVFTPNPGPMYSFQKPVSKSGTTGSLHL